jgi:hypothetical protein
MYISPNSKGKLTAEQKYDKKQQISLIPTCVTHMYSVFLQWQTFTFFDLIIVSIFKDAFGRTGNKHVKIFLRSGKEIKRELEFSQ